MNSPHPGPDKTAPRAPLFSPGDVAGDRYEIESYLAEGGMGQVYRALDLELRVRVALKTIHPRIAVDASSLQRFKQEILLARSISHANVCRIFDLGRDEGTGVSFLTMELLAGDTLASRIRRHDDSLPMRRFPFSDNLPTRWMRPIERVWSTGTSRVRMSCSFRPRMESGL